MGIFHMNDVLLFPMIILRPHPTRLFYNIKGGDLVFLLAEQSPSWIFLCYLLQCSCCSLLVLWFYMESFLFPGFLASCSLILCANLFLFSSMASYTSHSLAARLNLPFWEGFPWSMPLFRLCYFVPFFYVLFLGVSIAIVGGTFDSLSSWSCYLHT